MFIIVVIIFTLKCQLEIVYSVMPQLFIYKIVLRLHVFGKYM